MPLRQGLGGLGLWIGDGLRQRRRRDRRGRWRRVLGGWRRIRERRRGDEQEQDDRQGTHAVPLLYKYRAAHKRQKAAAAVSKNRGQARRAAMPGRSMP